ncbi:MAG: HPF/RaiA family ribosome-associated protein [Hyphomonas sp.]
MIVQVNTGNNIEGSATMAESLEALTRDRLSRFEDKLTRVEIHVTDENGPRAGGDDKQCVIEVRPTGLDPVKVTENAGSIHQATVGALGKMVSALDRTYGKLTSRKGH